MFIDVLISHIPLILSTVVNIIAIGYNFKQNSLLKNAEVMKIYAEKQFTAYENLLCEIAACSINFSKEQNVKLLSASLNASVFSSNETSEIINNFCGVYSQILLRGGLSKVSPEEGECFEKARILLTHYLRMEIFRYEKAIFRNKKPPKIT